MVFWNPNSKQALSNMMPQQTWSSPTGYIHWMVYCSQPALCNVEQSICISMTHIFSQASICQTQSSHFEACIKETWGFAKWNDAASPKASFLSPPPHVPLQWCCHDIALPHNAWRFTVGGIVFPLLFLKYGGMCALHCEGDHAAFKETQQHH